MELTLAQIAGTVLAQGIGFLFGQAGDVLSRWRDRRATMKTRAPADDAPVELPAGDFLEGQLAPARIDYAAVERLEPQLKAARAALLEYAEGEPIAPSNEQLVRDAEALRALLEAVYGQRITFKGEERPKSGPVAKGEIDADAVRGYAAAVRVGSMTGGEVHGKATVKTVEEGGTAVSVDIDRIG